MGEIRRVALVTGATSGIGLAIARRLAERGYRVIVHSRSSTEAGNALAAELGDGSYVQADLAVDADRRRLVAESVRIAGSLDVLVNNAGMSAVIPHSDLQAASTSMWRKLLEVNTIAPFRLVAEAEPHLRASARREGHRRSSTSARTPGCAPKGPPSRTRRAKPPSSTPPSSSHSPLPPTSGSTRSHPASWTLR